MPDIVDRVSPPLARTSFVNWGAVIAGSLIAAAFASVLHTFAGAIGLAVSSTSPTWRDASIALWILSGIYLVLVAIASYGLGGYVAGLLSGPTPFRATAAEATGTAATMTSAVDDVEMGDGLQGLIVWALATLLTAALLILAASLSTRLAAPSAGAAGPGTSVAGENLVAFDIDRLLRGDRRPAEDVTQTRAEVARILLTSSGHEGVAAQDRAFLVRLVSGRAGVGPPDAERRVDAAIASAKDNIARARRSTVILAFMAGAAALLGAAAAWFASVAGGEQRDGRAPANSWRVFTTRRQHPRTLP